MRKRQKEFLNQLDLEKYDRLKSNTLSLLDPEQKKRDLIEKFVEKL